MPRRSVLGTSVGLAGRLYLCPDQAPITHPIVVSPTCSTRSTMASTSQAVSSPETAAKVVFRQRLETQIAPRGPPSELTFVRFYHPANGRRFLTLESCL
jgi:hypothetical protein